MSLVAWMGSAGLAALVMLHPAEGAAQAVPVLGYLTNANADPERLVDFRSGLADLGYQDGRNIAIEVRGAKSNSDYPALAAEFVGRPVDIIIAVNAAATSAARKTTTTIPIVMTAVNDPVEWGFVRSLELAIPQVRANQVKAIAILSNSRSSIWPALASAQEQGLDGFEYNNWNAFFLPKAAPPAIIQKLHDATVAAMETPSVQQRLRDIGAEVVPPERRSPEYLQKLVESEIEKWSVPIKAGRLTGE